MEGNLPLVLNQSNALIVKKMGAFKSCILNQPLLWHKFVIHDGASLDRDKVLKVIVDKADDLFPIQYQIEDKNSSFIARNCCTAIDVLCSRNLVLEYPGGSPMIMSILLNKGMPTETTLKIQDVLMHVLNRRFTKKTGVLNLENLVKDPGLSDKVYCALSNHKILSFVLSLARGLGVKCLRLNNNEIKSIDGLEAAWAHRTITSIDLRNNLIENMVKLFPLKSMNIQELWLDGNPVCQNYAENGYVLAIKEICPNIERLDGQVLATNGVPAFRRNYLVKYEALDFVDQFLEHYFTLYDSNNRKSLEGLYYRGALFSLTCSLIMGQVTTPTARLDEYKRITRNLLKMSDYSKHDKYLFHTSEEIVKALCMLPPTEHDPYTFTVDLLYYSNVTAVLLVTGVFREQVEKLSDPDSLYGFTRTFVLTAAAHGEYNIINEQVHIFNATTVQVQRALKVVKVPSIIQNPKLYTNEDKNCIIETFARISTLNMANAKKMLESAAWDLKTALTKFVDQYKDGRLPPEAFKVT
ncbi:nuclear RNA export factor 1-like [Chrysoperla carnea]|uniref:nuclear RNA export factor 1-like n=1 Tax=Chrysoperla carnea TaxID=189513 RepID=UPI001D087E47|nr:nuclear RNA export factor 1-like [Chrysoperla carnea]